MVALDVEEGERKQAQRWHVGRELPLAVLIGLLIQTGTFIWFLSGLSTKVDYAVQQLQEFKDSRYTKADSMKDRDFYMAMIEAIRVNNGERDRRIIELENTVRSIRR